LPAELLVKILPEKKHLAPFHDHFRTMCRDSSLLVHRSRPRNNSSHLHILPNSNFFLCGYSLLPNPPQNGKGDLFHQGVLPSHSLRDCSGVLGINTANCLPDYLSPRTPSDSRYLKQYKTRLLSPLNQCRDYQLKQNPPRASAGFRSHPNEIY
jgi:hypothetical protein